MVYQCAQAVKIPIIGCGGITTPSDAIEYMLAGAAAVQVGTASFLSAMTLTSVIDGMSAYCRDGVSNVCAT